MRLSLLSFLFYEIQFLNAFQIANPKCVTLRVTAHSTYSKLNYDGVEILADATKDAYMAHRAPICMIHIDETTTLVDAVTNVGLDQNHALQLIQLGAVYARDSGLPLKRVMIPNALLTSGSRIRVHLDPQRYEACYCEHWDKRVAFEDDKYLVLHKPPGLPCMPHVSNKMECLHACAARALGYETLHSMHRIDRWTTGLVAVGKSKQAVSEFNRLLQNREVHKFYRVLTNAPVNTGLMTHFMPHKCMYQFSAPRLISNVRHPGWRLCQIIVHQCSQAKFHMPGRETKNSFQDTDDFCMIKENTYFESIVELITGRTHQIRAQFSAVGAPLVGDTQYLPMSGYVHDDINADNEAISRMSEAVDLNNVIGLQCFKLIFEGREVVATDPWWRKHIEIYPYKFPCTLIDETIA